MLPDLFGLGSRKPKVFGIGWAKTGTTTLGACFRTLGYRHQSQRLDLVLKLRDGNLREIRSLVRRHDSFEDWPWILLYPRLDAWHAGSKFVLTVRDTGRWLKSYRNLLARSKAGGDIWEIRSFIYGFDVRKASDDELIERYEQHNRGVRECFRERPDQLLEVSWENGTGWPELCAFLGSSVPDVPFPHENAGIYT